MTNRYDWNNILFLDKFSSDGVLSAIYFDGKLKNHYVKRFNVETNTTNKKFIFISQEKGSKLEYCTFKQGEKIVFKHYSDKKLKSQELDLDSFIEVKGWKSIGNKIQVNKIRSGSFSLLSREEIVPPEDNITKESKDKISEDKKVDENFDVGETLELDLDTDQLNLFNEKD